MTLNMVPRVPDPVFVTAQEAAHLAGVPLGTLRNWRRHGHLTPASFKRGPTGHRVPLYDMHEVWAVEKATREADPAKRRQRAVNSKRLD